ncbi:MAG: guanine deaminase [Elusimicrobia bacterium]|nr:MAG: guanine deaminase [Elusimicrobiota bacterium]
MVAKRYRLSILTYNNRGALQYYPDAILSVGEGGRIDEMRPVRGGVASRLKKGVKDLRGFLAIPGLIDTHCHLPQYPAVAADGLELLPWLEKHIFPVEASFKGEKVRGLARHFFEDMAAHGTTTACVFTTIWKQSTEICFEEALKAGVRVIMGKVMMDRASYDKKFGVYNPGRSRTDVSLSESEELCRKWHGRGEGRLLYAFTPRFALSCSEKLLRECATLAEKHGTYVQTHLSENRSEVREIKRLFPKAKNYTDVYRRAGMLGPKTILAHSIWLNENEHRLIASSGSVVAHCPTSNAFLGSGIMDLAHMRQAGIPVTLGSDVAAGPSLCLFEVMRQSIYLQRSAAAHNLFKTNPQPTPAKAFEMATLGGAKALGLGDKIGSLENGKDADFVVMDPSVYDTGGQPPVDAETAVSRLVYRASRHAVKASFVAGKIVGGRL